MSYKAIQNSSTSKNQKHITSNKILQKIQQENPSKLNSKQNQMKKRVLWSSSQKLPSQKSQKQLRPSKEALKLQPINQKSSFSNEIQSIEILKSVGDRQTSSKRKSSRSNVLPAKQHQLVQSKLRVETVAFERNESLAEKKMKLYLANMLCKGDEKQLIFVEEASQHFTKITTFTWNLTISMFTTLSSLLKNANSALYQRYAIAYIYSQPQIIKSELEILSIFDDTNHHSLICQCFYFEKIICLILSINNKKIELEMTQLIWIWQVVKKILTIRSLILEIVNEYEQSFLKFNKLKKPSYLIRQKKLISINKTMGDQRAVLQKLFKYSALKQYNFQLKSPILHEDLMVKIDDLKFDMLQIPKAPFFEGNTKDYILVCQPQGLFYVEDKKNCCIVIKQFAEEAIRRIAQCCDIIVFSRKKRSTLDTFIREIGDLPIKGSLDRSYMTYRQGKKIKDLIKIGVNLEKTIVLDLNYQKYYCFSLANCLPVNKDLTQEDLKIIVNHIEKITAEGISVTQKSLNTSLSTANESNKR